MKKTFDPNEPIHPQNERILSLRELLPAANIKLQLEARDKNAVLAEMAGYAHFLGTVLDRDSLLIALVERERMLSTAMPGGVAFLHPRRRHPKLIKQSGVLLGISKEGIGFDSPDGEKTHLFFLLLLKTDTQHLKTLGELGRMFLDGTATQKILQAGSTQAIFDLLPKS